MRPKKGGEIWNHKTHIVVFYDIISDLPVAMFESIWEIVDYRNLPHVKRSYDLISIELFNALRRETHTTEMLGQKMTVYMIDIQNEEDE